MTMRYGLNEADSWWFFSQGPGRERIKARVRELRPQIIRPFVFDKGTPDPVADWPTFKTYIQAVLDVGATPMVTFAKCGRPFRDPRAIRWFANQCGDVVWNSLEEWGAEAVRDWYWIVWNEPNSTWIGGGLTFEEYSRAFNEVAHAIRPWLAPHLQGKPLPLGGPSIEGFDPFWVDWIVRFVDEIDPALYSFVNWHRYADWRNDGEEGAPCGDRFLALLMAQAEHYGERARRVSEIIAGLGVMNVCGEWNAHSHYEPRVRREFNQTLFGAVFGAAVLLHLLRAGIDAEMLWTGTDEGCGYGLVDGRGRTTPLFHVKRLFAQYVPYGCWVRFPRVDTERDSVLSVSARTHDGQRSLLLVHTEDCPRTIACSQVDDWLGDWDRVLLLDRSTEGRVSEARGRGRVTFHGRGVAVITNAVA
jgi:Glycosyl hydrolases family 39